MVGDTTSRVAGGALTTNPTELATNAINLPVDAIEDKSIRRDNRLIDSALVALSAGHNDLCQLGRGVQ